MGRKRAPLCRLLLNTAAHHAHRETREILSCAMHCYSVTLACVTWCVWCVCVVVVVVVQTVCTRHVSDHMP